MTDELIAKTVFGEITLGEVLDLFLNRISTISIGGSEWDSWYTDDDFLYVMAQERKFQDREISFRLDGKVKVYEGHLEVFSGNKSYRLVFHEAKAIQFDSLLPRKASA